MSGHSMEAIGRPPLVAVARGTADLPQAARGGIALLLRREPLTQESLRETDEPLPVGDQIDTDFGFGRT